MTPYYEDAWVTLFHGDCREVDAWLAADVLVTDPPYGIAYHSGRFGTLPRSIAGDGDTGVRDAALVAWGPLPALVFGTWRKERPAGTRQVLVWDTGGALGMGALDLPWKPSHQEVYVLGSGFVGKRTSDVLRVPPVQAKAQNGRVHPHEKPVALMSLLVSKCPPGVIADPFMGSGPTLIAAKAHGRKAIGVEVEVDEAYCESAAKRLSQEVLDFGGGT